jgi:tRNA G18 (ribose-2'-O)-methylase SpoU
MTASSYQIRICENPACGLRYPLVDGHPFGERCPLCLGSTKVVLARQLSPEPFSPLNEPNPAPNQWLHAVLDNVRSAWNVGAMFRTADGLGVEKLYLCGITPTPENDAVRKTSLGAEETVEWEYARDAVKLAERLKAEGYVLWGLEQDQRSVALSATDGKRMHAYRHRMTTDERMSSTDSETDKRIVLVVGNEVTGVDPGLLDLCDQIVHIPMRGGKRSLNVEVAFAIAAWVVNGY